MDDESGAEKVEYRWGHSEGITAVDCVVLGEGGSEKLVTCGADSDLRVWNSFDDGDPVAHELSDNGLTLICGRNGEVYVGTEYNTVEALNLEDGKNLGVKAKFTAQVNHVDLSVDGKWLVAGSGDMKIQLINLEDSAVPPVTIDTHSAPVLSVALDPSKEFLASSGCDGNVCIWSLTEEGKPVHLVKKLENIFPSSNDITTSSTLCRLSWEGNGKILAVPEEDHIALYARDSWAKLKVLRSQKSKKIASVTKFSQCGNYLAAGGSDGSLTVWNVSDSKILAESAQFSDQVTGIVYTNKGSDILAADCKGRILLLKDFKTQAEKLASKPTSEPQQSSKTNDAVASDDDDDMDVLSPPPEEPKEADGDEFDDGLDDLFTEDNEFDLTAIKAETGFFGDQYVGVKKAKKMIVSDDLADDDKSKGSKSDDENDDAQSVVSSVGGRRPQSRPQPQPKIIIPFTEPQKPFQPSSTPVHLDHRFMIWNNVGSIRNYSHENDEKQAIDIDFHDAAVHHAVHLRNQNEYTIAALTKELAAFANEKQSGSGSTLFCYNFGAWDSKKEWTTELPCGEEIVGLAAGDGWIAAATNMNRIRIFTNGGAQKQLIEVGGQIIATSGHEDLLFITFHNGIGLHGNQCIAYSIFRIKPSLKPFPLVPCEPLPISPESQVAWVGFSDEGTPVCSDSKNMLRILSGRYWTTFCSLKEQLYAGNTDHFWVVGVSELDQRIRGVKCKGMKYPPTLPRPVLMQVDAQIPLCEMETEKSRLEDKFLRSLMLDALSKKMDKKNYDVDECKSKAEKELKESLFNLFVLSCKGDWDARGAEYVSMMPSAHGVQVAVKYASKQRKKGLVDRLTALGRKKLDEEDLEDEGDDDDFETLKMGTIVYSHVQNRSLAGDYSASQDMFPESNNSRFNASSMSLSNSFSAGNRSIITVPDEENPFMKKNTEEIRKLLGTSDSSSNRFRKDKPQNTSGETGEGGKGLSVIDSWKKPTEKPTDLFAKTVTRNSKGGGKKGGSEKEKAKDQAPSKEKKKQATLLDLAGTKKIRHSSGADKSANPASPAVADISEESNDSALIENQGSDKAEHGHVANSESLLEDSTNTRHPDKPAEEQPQKARQGYLLWFDENRENLEKEHPELEVKELTKIGAKMYRKLSPEEKKRYTTPSIDSPKEDKKRKRSEVEEEKSNGSTEGEKKSKLTSKLAAFACSNTD